MKKSVLIDEEVYFVNLAFDIDDFIGDGIWWLQVYDYEQNLLYDKPFASSRGNLDFGKIKKIVRGLTFDEDCSI